MHIIKNMCSGIFIFALGTITLSLPSAEAAAAHQEWNFDVTLDGEPFGSHIFTVDENTKHQWKVTSKADYTLGLVGIPVFHYHHLAHEQWTDGCLTWLVADTDHDGDMIHVSAQATPIGGTVNSTDKTEAHTSWNGCLLDFAYWNPHMRDQTKLLNPETGEIENVTITQEAEKTIMVHGQSTPANVWRITGPHDPVDVLYDHEGHWVGLDATVKGGHALSYRLP